MTDRRHYPSPSSASAATRSAGGLVRRRSSRGWSAPAIWQRLRRGAYVGRRPARRQSLPCTACSCERRSAGLHRPAVVSHQSAAVLLGLPLWDVALDRVHVTRRPPASNNRRPRALLSRRSATGTTRSWRWTACWSPSAGADGARPGAFAADTRPPWWLSTPRCNQAAARPRDMLRDSTVRHSPEHPGSRSATRAVHVRRQSKRSVGESRSRVIRARWELGAVRAAVRGRDRRRAALVGRTDFAWEEHGVVGEFDGRVKYGRLLRPGQEPGDAVFEEKRREDAIRDEGWGVVRWVWSDLTVPAPARRPGSASAESGRPRSSGDQLLGVLFSLWRVLQNTQKREQHPKAAPGSWLGVSDGEVLEHLGKLRRADRAIQSSVPERSCA